jgi:autotransporter-associated beta strand protein
VPIASSLNGSPHFTEIVTARFAAAGSDEKVPPNPKDRIMKIPPTKSVFTKSLVAAALMATTMMNASGASGTWVSLSSGDWNGVWSDSSRWSGNVIADGAGSIADFATVGITSAGMTVTIDGTSRTVGKLYIGDANGTAGSATIAGSDGGSLIFNNNGSNALLRMGNQVGGAGSSSGNPVATISAAVGLSDSLDLENNFNLANASLRVSGNISANTAGTKTITNITNAGNRSNAGVILSGTISNGAGSIAIVQNSTTGNMTLTRANSYTGGTTISAGTLLLTGAGTVGAGNVDVGVAGTWDVSGITAEVYSMTSVQTLSGFGAINAAGKGILLAGTLASRDLNVTGDFTLTSTANVNVDIAGLDLADQFTVSGMLTLGGTLNLNTTYTAQLGDVVTLFDAGLLNGAFTGYTGLDLGSGLVWDVSRIGIDGSITVIPEPGTLSLVALAGLAGLAVRSRMARLRLF